MFPINRQNTSEVSRLPSRLWWGSVLLWYVWCMTLPLVGRAGAQTAHAGLNRLTVSGLLLLSLALALPAGWKMSLQKSRPCREWILWRLWIFFLMILTVCLFLGAFGG